MKKVPYWQEYLSYLQACGWTNEEFNNETLKRVDNNWNEDKVIWN